MIPLLLAYQEWKKTHFLLSCLAGSPRWHWKTLPHTPRSQTPVLSLDLAWNQHSLSSIFKPHSTWWAVIYICIKFESPVVFGQLGLMGNVLLQHSQKTKQAEANNWYSLGGQGVSLHRVCRLRSCKELWHSHLLFPLREWFFSVIQNSYPIQPVKVMGNLCL